MIIEVCCKYLCISDIFAFNNKVNADNIKYGFMTEEKLPQICCSKLDIMMFSFDSVEMFTGEWLEAD